MSDNKSLFTAEGGSLIAADLADSLVETGSAAGTGNTAFLKFTKAGQWVFGSDQDEVGVDEIFAVNPASFVIGWQGWNDGQPVEGPVVPVNQRNTLPAENELPEIPDGDMNGWSKMVGVDFQSVEDQQPMNFKVTSYGGKKAVTQLMKEVGLGLKEHPEAPIALVKLTGDKYKHDKFGWIHYPVVSIVGWADVNGKEVKKLAA